jgi:hypothetical protein
LFIVRIEAFSVIVLPKYPKTNFCLKNQFKFMGAFSVFVLTIEIGVVALTGKNIWSFGFGIIF